MENSFQTSFIPKKPITSNISDKSSRPPTSILTLLAFLILIIIGGASVGLFLYKNYLIKQKEVLSISLQKVRDSFEKDTISELELYDKRVGASRKILNNHLVLSPMFALLGSLTLPSIQYTSLSHTSSSQGFSAKLSGAAVDYKSIALQADVFNSAKGRFFKDVVFSNLVKDKNNTITFNLEFNVDPALLSYEKNMAIEQIQAKAKAQNDSQQLPAQIAPPAEVDANTAIDANVTLPDQPTTQTGGDNPPINQEQ